MKITKTVTRQVEVVIDTLCDKCNKPVYTEDNYDAFNFDFKVKTGNAYPEGGNGEEKTLDLCPSCAEGLLTLLKENNYRVQTKEWGY